MKVNSIILKPSIIIRSRNKRVNSILYLFILEIKSTAELCGFRNDLNQSPRFKFPMTVTSHLNKHINNIDIVNISCNFM